MKLYTSGEDYLEAILVLHNKMGMACSFDGVRHIEVSNLSVYYAIAILQHSNFFTMDEDHFLHLTKVDLKIVEEIYEQHCFFKEQLKSEDNQNNLVIDE